MATHGGARAVHDAEYNLHDDDIVAIMRRDGVVGLIASSHWMSPRARPTGSFDETMAVLMSHIDHLEKLATDDGLRAGHHYVASGSDQDGFIKPPLAGLEFPGGYAAVATALEQRYGVEAAGRICSGNAQRVLQHWGVRE
jgi:microsomal dipeptidase-like Zn-dependent dipeptidase